MFIIINRKAKFIIIRKNQLWDSKGFDPLAPGGNFGVAKI